MLPSQSANHSSRQQRPRRARTSITPSRRIASTLALALALALVAAPMLVLPARADDSKLSRAKALFDRAEAQYRLQEFNKALADYREAARLAPRPNLLFNIAQCYRKLKRLDKAIFYYKLYIADWQRGRPNVAVPHLAEVRQRISTLQSAMAAELAAKKRAAERANAAPQRGRLVLANLRAEGAKILVDGVLRGVAPLVQAVELDAGPHRVRIEAPAHQPWTREIVIKAGQPNKIWVDLQSERTRSALWLTSSIVSLALAGGAEAMALVFRSKANEHYRGTPPFDDDQRIVTAGHVLAGVLGALAVTSFVLYLRSGGRRSKQAASLAVQPQLAGAAALGTISF